MRITFSVRILVGYGLSNFGNWLTFLGIALFVQEHYGNAQVPFTFIVQSIPSLAFSRRFASLLPRQKHGIIYVVLQFVAAILLLPLMIAPSLITIYIFLIGSSIGKAVANPLFASLVGEWVRPNELRSAQVRLSAIGAGTLAVAPILGGFIAQTIGYQCLFALDALSYVAASVLLMPLPIRNVSPRPLRSHGEAGFWLPPEVRGPVVVPLALWVGWMFVGIYMTGIEFLLFDFNALTKPQVGLVLGAWGIANLVAVPVAGQAPVRKITLWVWSLIYTFGLVLFASGKGIPSAWVGFLIAGFCSAILTGSLRAEIQRSLLSSTDSLPVWAWSNQVIAVMNIFIYAMLGVAISKAHAAGLATLMIVISCAFAAMMYSKREHFSHLTA